MKIRFIIATVLLLVLAPLATSKFHRPLISAPPTSIKDTLDNSQLSYFGRILTATQNQSVITVGFTMAPSTTSNNLTIGDTVGIGTTGAGVGTTGPLTIYTIKDIGLGSTNSIELNTGIGQSNAWVGAAVIATRSAIHTITWIPQSNLIGGFWQFLIKASNNVGETNADGIPDQGGFDLGQDVGATTVGLGTRLKVADVACPNFITGVGTTLASSIGTTLVSGNLYHVITCALGAGATNTIGGTTPYTVTIGRPLATGSQLINPAPVQGSHTLGTADTHTFYVRHLNSSGVLDEADTAQGKIAVTDTVRVTATVDPTITFSIGTAGLGTTACGVPLKGSNANVTATAVPFGSLSIGVTSDTLAQTLNIITNGNGFVVTTYENRPLTNISTNTTIPSTDCVSGTCTITTASDWNVPESGGGAKSEFGYSLQAISAGTSTAFTSAGSNFTAKPFGIGAANAATVMSYNTTPLITHTAAVCYRIITQPTQESGNYENEVIYTATATF